MEANFKMAFFLNYLFIFCARVVDVSMSTVRMLLIVRGKKYLAAAIGFFEVIVYITALGRVVSGLDNVGNLLAYASGFAAGNIAGSYIENKMALGTMMVSIIPKKVCDVELAEELRNMGYGVTMVDGMGKDGPICILNIALHRKELPVLMKYLDQADADAFITVSDARATRGGYIRKIKKK
jgi:uncharacterized protein YebE (UPF0316 family)